LVSLIIAFTINPWLSYIWAKDVVMKTSDRVELKIEKNKFDIRNYYLKFMKLFLNEKQAKKRKVFKMLFWITLFSVILAPIYL
jgi:multidrug efflux pump subunit AcrB